MSKEQAYYIEFLAWIIVLAVIFFMRLNGLDNTNAIEEALINGRI